MGMSAIGLTNRHLDLRTELKQFQTNRTALDLSQRGALQSQSSQGRQQRIAHVRQLGL
jgi:hypothetical protein